MMKKYEELMKQALQMLQDDGELFVDMVNELDSWNGYADGFRAWPMEELDELFYGVTVSDFLQKLAPGFNLNDAYMIDTIYGLDSTDNVEELYRCNVDAGELLDNIIDNANHIYFYNRDFEELVTELVNYDEETDEETTKAGALDTIRDRMTEGFQTLAEGTAPAPAPAGIGG